jgi:hypothetical protein
MSESFKCQLLQAIEAASSVTVGGYHLERFSSDNVGPGSLIELGLDGAYAAIFVLDCEVEIVAGGCSAVIHSVDGGENEDHCAGDTIFFDFMVEKALSKEDVL